MRRPDFLFANLQQGKILDVGNLGANGKIHDELLRRFPRSEIHGLDIVDQKDRGKNYANQSVGSAEKMPYASDTFDTVYLGEVIEHTWTPLVLISECHRVLKKGGVFVLDTPNIYALSRMARYGLVGLDVILGDPDHKIFYSRAVLDNLLKKTGFTVIEVTSDNTCTIKSRTFSLPRIGPFRSMGEHLLAAAQK